MSAILTQLTTQLHDAHDTIETWLQQKRKDAPPFVTTSVDLRHSGTRLVPIDTNLFPAGFHLLSPAGRTRACQVIEDFLRRCFPKARKALIIPEQHSRNTYYHNNLHVLAGILHSAGLDVRIGHVPKSDIDLISYTNEAGDVLPQQRTVRDGNMLRLEEGFTPDFILVNNDFSAGSPETLKDLAQPVLPPPGMGWYRRKKHIHFQAYAELAAEFGAIATIDPWLISAQFEHCGLVDFKKQERLECVAKATDRVIAHAKEKHAFYGIDAHPYVFIKADSGTYGMGIMTAHSGDEVMELNKKARNKMHAVKEGSTVSDVIIQEGIPTIDRIEGYHAEPMVYLADGIPIGGMYRINTERDAYGNLNARGMEFRGMCDEEESDDTTRTPVEGCDFHVFGLIATLAALAAAREFPLMMREPTAPVQECGQILSN